LAFLGSSLAKRTLKEWTRPVVLSPLVAAGAVIEETLIDDTSDGQYPPAANILEVARTSKSSDASSR
jgi:hypothetical protein